MAGTPRWAIAAGRPTAVVSSDVIRSSGRVMRNVFLNEQRQLELDCFHSVFPPRRPVVKSRRTKIPGCLSSYLFSHASQRTRNGGARMAVRDTFPTRLE